jgi:NCAIR mutase (PurE)-related protein
MNIKHDRDREKRCGVPEVVFGENKSTDDLLEASASFLVDCGRIIITRISEKKADAVLSSIDARKYLVTHNVRGRVLVIKQKNFKTKPIGTVAILSAGTSDIPVAEEAAAVAEELGCQVVREYDVGIAGIHRVFSALERVKTASVFIVVAGMEGALPSVVAGLVKQPVIAVPTSVGYGTGAGGLAALNTMLNSCTPLAVVNIDNGYGAAVLAYKIIKT